MKKSIRIIFSLSISFLLGNNILQAQNISNIIQDDINSVEHHISCTTIKISDADVGETYEIHVNLSNQGIEMVNSGSNLLAVTGGTLGTISGTVNNPIIEVTASASNFDIKIPKKATCAAYDLLTGGTAGVFKDQAKIDSDGDLFVPTANYQVNYSAISILSINDDSSTITPSQSIERTLRLVQGLPSYVEEFYIELNDLDGIISFSDFQLIGDNTISIPALQVNTVGNITTIKITSADIQGALIGDDDGLFDLNEILEFVYDFQLDAGCPSGNSIRVEHTTYWGPLGDITRAEACQETTSTKSITFREELPDLAVTTTSTTPSECLGYGNGFVEHTITFENTGDADLLNLSFEIEGEYSDYNVVDAGTITFNLEGDAPTAVSADSTKPLDDGAGCASSVPDGANFVNSAVLSIPVNIPPGEKLEVTFRTYACCPTGCLSFYSAHDYDIRDITYNEICGSTLSEGNIDKNFSQLSWNSILDAPSNFFEDSPVQYAYLDIINGDLEDFLLNSNATFTMEVNLPGGLDIGNTASTSDIIWAGLTNPGAANGTSVVTDDGFSMVWDADALQYAGGTIGFPLILDCSEARTDEPIEISFYITPETGCPDGDCRIQVVCETVSISMLCPGDCDSSITHEFYDFYRENIDAPDSDNNGCPDTDNDCDGILAGVDGDEIAAPAFNESQIRKYRVIEGDTLISHVLAVIQNDVPIGSVDEFRRVMMQDDFGTTAERNRYFPLGADLRYVDVSDGNTYLGTRGTSTSGTKRQIRIRPQDIGQNNTTFRFQHNDTIEIKARYIIKAYTTAGSELRSIENKMFGKKGTNFNDTDDQYGCIEFAGNVTQFSMTVNSVDQGDVTIDGCQEKDIVRDIRFLVGGSEYTQFFPYEYRKIGHIDSFAVRYKNTFEYVDAAVRIRSISQNPGPEVAIVPTQTIPDGDHTILIFDLNHASNSGIFSDNGGLVFPGDESYRFQLFVNIHPTCESENNVNLELDPENDVSFAQVVRRQFFNSQEKQLYDISREVRARIADIQVSSPTQTEPYTSSTMAWNLDVFNNDRFGDAEYIWGLVEAPGNIDLNTVQFLEDDSGTISTISPNANGLFELGNLDTRTTRNFQIGAAVLECEPDSLVIYIGNRCGAYPTSIAEAKEKCNERYVVYVEPKDAQVSSVITPLASAVDPEDGTTPHGKSTISMCEPFPMEFQIVSGQLQPIDDIVLNFPSVGNGLEFVSGSGYLWYDKNGDGDLDADGADDTDDSGSNDDERIPFSAVGNSSLVANNGSGNDFVFDIKTLGTDAGAFDWDNIDGIPGVSSIPQNILYIRFEMETTCEVVIGAPVTVKTFAGNGLCSGNAIGNGELRSGFVLDIEGADNPYDAASPAVSSNNLNSCGIQPLDFSFTKNGATAVNTLDSIVVFLPTGLNYDSFGSNAGDEAVSNMPAVYPTADGTIIKWAVPLGLDDGEAVDFSINVEPATSECIQFKVNMEVQAVIQIKCKDALCAETRTIIGTKAETIKVELPEFTIDLLTLNPTGGNTYSGVLKVYNISDVDHNGDLTIDLYPYDGTNTPSGAVIHSITVVAGVDANGVETVNFSFSTTEDLNSGVIALLPNSGDNCYCSLPNPGSVDSEEMPSDIETPTLPVELVNFEAEEKDCKISLSWETAIEDQFSHFIIERKSAANRDYKTIGVLNGKYPTGGNYAFTDDKIRHAADYYYRLKMIDQDNSFEYSSIVSVTTACGNKEIQIRPNPVTNSRKAVIGFHSIETMETINIFDASGRVVKTLHPSLEANQYNEIQIDMGQLPSGMYFIQITSTGQSEKLIIRD